MQKKLPQFYLKKKFTMYPIEAAKPHLIVPLYPIYNYT